MERKTRRNILVFILLALASGWLGVLVDLSIGPQPGDETLGMGVWLVLPLLATLLLRLSAGDGWKDIGLRPNFLKNINWYLVSVIIFPIVTALVLALGTVMGWVSLSNFNTKTFIAGFSSLLIANFIKNIFEEFVWRGYLTTKLLSLGSKDLWVYLIVGGIWGLWHLPYYLFFLPQADMNQVLPVDRLLFSLIAIVTMTGWSVMFVELYRITGSIWSVVVLHTIEDSLINHLVTDGHLTIGLRKEILISPIVGVITCAFYITVGLWLRRSRVSKEKLPGENRG